MAGIIPTTTPSQDIFIESDRSSHIDFQNVKTASDTMKVNIFVKQKKMFSTKISFR